MPTIHLAVYNIAPGANFITIASLLLFLKSCTEAHTRRFDSIRFFLRDGDDGPEPSQILVTVPWSRVSAHFDDFQPSDDNQNLLQAMRGYLECAATLYLDVEEGAVYTMVLGPEPDDVWSREFNPSVELAIFVKGLMGALSVQQPGEHGDGWDGDGWFDRGDWFDEDDWFDGDEDEYEDAYVEDVDDWNGQGEEEEPEGERKRDPWNERKPHEKEEEHFYFPPTRRPMLMSFLGGVTEEDSEDEAEDKSRREGG